MRQYFTEDVQIYLRRTIAQAGGNEVFFVGRTDSEKVVDKINVLARGNEVEVPAIISNCRPGEVVIHNHPSGHLTPSAADLRVASSIGNEGVGFYITNNLVDEIYVVVEPTCFEKQVGIDFNELRIYFESGGPLAQKLQNFEMRKPQIEMMESVVGAFNENKISVIEAGTGTGKTMAYLLPAIQWSLANGKRVVISTNTINLQQQLTEKDIPLLQSIFPKKFRAELVKGRTNYVCLRKLNEAISQPSLLDIDGVEAELKQLFKWAQKTKDGSKTDLGMLPGDRVWEHIQSESDTTLKSRCPYYHKCFFYNARRRAATADILIANHHLLFADLSVRSLRKDASEVAVLPSYERIILDEAHNLEDVASKYFGVSASYYGIMRILNRLYRQKNGRQLGNLPFLQMKINYNLRIIPQKIADEILGLLEKRVVPEVEKTKVLLTEVAERIFHWMSKNRKSDYEEVKLRLKPEIFSDGHWREVIQDVPLLTKEMQNLADLIYKIIDQLEKIHGDFEKQASSLAVDLKARSERLMASANSIDLVLLKSDEENIRWIEAREGRRYGHIVRFCTSPLEIAPIMKQAVFERFPTVVMTSATLSVGKTFQYFNDRTGLNALDGDERVSETILSSPFDFQHQVMIGIPIDISKPNFSEYEQQLPGFLYQAITATRGRAFALFTSYYLLRKMFDELEPMLQDLNITLLKQGDQSRHILLNRFRQDVSSVLFGTDSFWEGVDVQGEPLIHVIIPRLPFKVPSEPVIEARVEAIERRGGNSFLEYTVPQAAIKFKQGFGRLIRTRQDFGAITILDRRIVSKSYGRVFLASLPDCQVVVGHSEEVFSRIRTFIEMHEGKGKTSN